MWVFTRSGSAWTQQGNKLKAAGDASIQQFGWKIALSADGNTALIAGVDNSRGVVWEFARSASSFAQQPGTLVAADETGSASFGDALAFSADATTALIGGSHDNSSIGAAWSFTLSAAVPDGGLSGSNPAGPTLAPGPIAPAVSTGASRSIKTTSATVTGFG